MPITNTAVRQKERDPERSKSNIKNAVGQILKEKGYVGLTVSNIAKAAGVAPRLVTYYFGTVEKLVEEYLSEKDYWLTFAKKLEDALVKEDPSGLEDLLYAILIAHYDCFDKDEEMRKLITWEISEYNDLLLRESNIREQFGSIIFKKTNTYFIGTDVDIRGEMAIMTAGIYYLILHTKNNGSTFCELDLTTEEGKNIIFKAIRRILSLSFQYAEKTRKK